MCVRTCVCARVCMRACVRARARAHMCGFVRNVDLGYAHVPTSALGACACKCTCMCVCTCVCAKLGVYWGGGGGGSRCWFCMALLSGVRKDSVAVALQFRRCM